MPHAPLCKAARPPILAWALLGAAGWGLGGSAVAQPLETGPAAPTAAVAASELAAAAAASAPAPSPAPASAASSPASAASAPAEPAKAAAPARPKPRKAATPNAGGPGWSSLTPAQRAALRPLQREWSEIDAPRKRKWLEIAQRFPRLTPDERARLHERMAQWALMSPQQRSNARLAFQEAQLLPPQVRQDRWAEYLALPEPERLRLLEQAEQSQGRTGRTPPRGTIAGSPFAKTNIVPNPLHAAPPQPVAPAILRAGPGATTLPLRQHPHTPWHLQPGLPKIAATPEFVDARTLAPRVGPQALGVIAPPRGGRP